MTIAAYLALFGWIPVVLVLFALMPGRRAAAAAVVGGWLLLPPYLLPIASLPDYSKSTAATIGMILGTVFFRPDRILAFRPRWFDLPMLAYCFSGVASSLSNGLGEYDGFSDALRQIMYWGLPYLFGRLYFNSPGGLQDFTLAMVIGGLIYVLPCLWEIRMSPQLLGDVYGFTGWQGTRLGGYRPHVFFRTGLECGLWMTAVSLSAWWLWRCGIIKKGIGHISFGWLAAILLATTVLCRSTGALILLVGGMGLLWASTRFKTRLLLLALVLCGPIYVGLRIRNVLPVQYAVAAAKKISAERAESLGYRFECEDKLVIKALEQPIFGWGGWNRSAVYFDENYQDSDHQVPADGLWISTLGTKGFFGLSLLYLAMELPAMLFLWRFPARLWRHPQVAPATLAAVFMGLYMVDCLLNGFINIIYLTLAGGLISITPAQLFSPGPRQRRGTRAVGEPEGRRGSAIAPIAGRTTSLDRSPVNNSPRPAAPVAGNREIDRADRCRSLGRDSKIKGRVDEARAAWQTALDILTRLTALHPDDPGLQRRWCDCANDLAWLILNHSVPAAGNPASALALASQVVQRCSDCGVYWNTLGVAYYRAGDFGPAVAALDRATALGDGGTPFDHVFLAMAHARLGNREQALQWLEQAMIRADQEYSRHPELARFCEEAESVISAVSETS